MNRNERTSRRRAVVIQAIRSRVDLKTSSAVFTVAALTE
jgi:hypothetical protein